MSPAGGSESVPESSGPTGRAGSLALLFAISSLTLGVIAYNERPPAGPISAPFAMSLEQLFPGVELPSDGQPHAVRVQHPSVAVDVTQHKAAPAVTASGNTVQATLPKADVVKLGENASPLSRPVTPRTALGADQLRTPVASAGRAATNEAPTVDADRAFSTAFSQAASPLTEVPSRTSSVNPTSLAATAQIPAAEAGAGVIARQAGSNRYVSGGVSAANRLGAVAINSDAQIGHLDTSNAAANKPSYDAVNVRTSFTVPAFHRPIKVSVGGGYERMLQTGGPHLNPLDLPPTVEGSAAIDGTGASSALNNAGRLSLNRAGYTTSVSVPVASRVNVGVTYAQRTVNGGAGMAQAAPIDERQHLYTGSVTYQGRSGRSSLTLIGRESRAVDSTATAPDTKIRRGDLVFSVKF